MKSATPITTSVSSTTRPTAVAARSTTVGDAAVTPKTDATSPCRVDGDVDAGAGDPDVGGDVQRDVPQLVRLARGARAAQAADQRFEGLLAGTAEFCAGSGECSWWG
ncbi:hypothetical protein E8P82_09705 [Arthrobacter echini]|uniref:Uncharacterized protein n=1 Tax=Arthrobacter echini TaxID=1529066 RepID=A0A4S5E457_9MICC|nr:hypothetical protein [Arthrobacter echini]THJ66261.1 hypothetical protein E8P82_09705 [Arthrobacter echini]